MTCVWQALMRSIRKDEVTERNIGRFRNPRELVQCLKRKNVKTSNVVWQGQPLRTQELNENYEWIKDYNVSGIQRGHLTSACCPFQLLTCQLLQVRIDHHMRYRGRVHRITIKPKHLAPRYTITLHSANGHMT